MASQPRNHQKKISCAPACFRQTKIVKIHVSKSLTTQVFIVFVVVSWWDSGIFWGKKNVVSQKNKIITSLDIAVLFGWFFGDLESISTSDRLVALLHPAAQELCRGQIFGMTHPAEDFGRDFGGPRKMGQKVTHVTRWTEGIEYVNSMKLSHTT